jgi:hypothetical protein
MFTFLLSYVSRIAPNTVFVAMFVTNIPEIFVILLSLPFKLCWADVILCHHLSYLLKKKSSQVSVDSIHDRNVGVIFDPKSLIKALTDLICETASLTVKHPEV